MILQIETRAASNPYFVSSNVVWTIHSALKQPPTNFHWITLACYARLPYQPKPTKSMEFMDRPAQRLKISFPKHMLPNLNHHHHHNQHILNWKMKKLKKFFHQKTINNKKSRFLSCPLARISVKRLMKTPAAEDIINFHHGKCHN